MTVCVCVCAGDSGEPGRSAGEHLAYSAGGWQPRVSTDH